METVTWQAMAQWPLVVHMHDEGTACVQCGECGDLVGEMYHQATGATSTLAELTAGLAEHLPHCVGRPAVRAMRLGTHAYPVVTRESSHAST